VEGDEGLSPNDVNGFCRTGGSRVEDERSGVVVRSVGDGSFGFGRGEGGGGSGGVGSSMRGKDGCFVEGGRGRGRVSKRSGRMNGESERRFS